MLKLTLANLSYNIRLNFNPPSDFLNASSPHPLLMFCLLSLPDRKAFFLVRETRHSDT